MNMAGVGLGDPGAGKGSQEVSTHLGLNQANPPCSISNRGWANIAEFNLGSTVLRHKGPRFGRGISSFWFQCGHTSNCPWLWALTWHLPTWCLGSTGKLFSLHSHLSLSSTFLSPKNQSPVNVTSLNSSWIYPFLSLSATTLISAPSTFVWISATVSPHPLSLGQCDVSQKMHLVLLSYLNIYCPWNKYQNLDHCL